MKHIKIAIIGVVSIVMIAFQSYVTIPNAQVPLNQIQNTFGDSYLNFLSLQASNLREQVARSFTAGYGYARNKISELTSQSGVADGDDETAQKKRIGQQRRLLAVAFLGAAGVGLGMYLFLPAWLTKLTLIKDQEDKIEAARNAFEVFTAQISPDDKSAKSQQQELWNEYQELQKKLEKLRFNK